MRSYFTPVARFKTFRVPDWAQPVSTPAERSVWRLFLRGDAYLNPMHTVLQRIQRAWFGVTTPGPHLRTAVEILERQLWLHSSDRKFIVVREEDLLRLTLTEYTTQAHRGRRSIFFLRYLQWEVATQEAEYTFHTDDSVHLETEAVHALLRHWRGYHLERQGSSARGQTMKGRYTAKTYALVPKMPPVPPEITTTVDEEHATLDRQPRDLLEPPWYISRKEIYLPLAELPAPHHAPKQDYNALIGPYQDRPFRPGAICIRKDKIEIELEEGVEIHRYKDISELLVGKIYIHRSCILPEYTYETYFFQEVRFTTAERMHRYFVADTHYQISLLSLEVHFVTGFAQQDLPEYSQNIVRHEQQYESRSCDLTRIVLSN